MDIPRVLVSAAYGPAAQSIIYGLLNQDEFPIEIVCADADKNHCTFAERQFKCRTYLVPRATSNTYADTLRTIVEKERPRLFIPIFDAELETIAAMREELHTLGCSVFIPSVTALARVLDKRMMYEHAVRMKIPHAPALYPATVPDTYPLFIKPARGVGSANARVIYNETDFVYWTWVLENYILQMYIRGEEFTVDLLRVHGKVYGAVSRQRLEIKGGVAIRCQTVFNPDLMTLAVSVAHAFDAEGICNIQFFREHGTGTLLFSEINMRPAGASALSVAAGFNAPLMLLKIALGKPVTPLGDDYIQNLSMLGHFNPFFYH